MVKGKYISLCDNKIFDNLASQMIQNSYVNEKQNKRRKIIKYNNEQYCGNCQYMFQAKYGCNCSNPEIGNHYVYWSYGKYCKGYTKGKRLTEKEMNELGYIKKVLKFKGMNKYPTNDLIYYSKRRK